LSGNFCRIWPEIRGLRVLKNYTVHNTPKHAKIVPDSSELKNEVKYPIKKSSKKRN
jgi:hypothetical protein